MRGSCSTLVKLWKTLHGKQKSRAEHVCITDALGTCPCTGTVHAFALSRRAKLITVCF